MPGLIQNSKGQEIVSAANGSADYTLNHLRHFFFLSLALQLQVPPARVLVRAISLPAARMPHAQKTTKRLDVVEVTTGFEAFATRCEIDLWRWESPRQLLKFGQSIRKMRLFGSEFLGLFPANGKEPITDPAKCTVLAVRQPGALVGGSTEAHVRSQLQRLDSTAVRGRFPLPLNDPDWKMNRYGHHWAFHGLDDPLPACRLRFSCSRKSGAKWRFTASVITRGYPSPDIPEALDLDHWRGS